jgi:hypothetical protein
MSRRRDDFEVWRSVERMVAPRRTSFPVLMWNWWKEILILTGLVLLGFAIGGTFGLPGLICGLSALVGACMMPWSPRSRACLWLLVTPHLLRSGLYQAGLQNRSGRIPLIVRVTCEPFGERVRLRCPAGICAEDVYLAREILSAACRAADVLVIRDEMRAHLVTLDVIRRYDRSVENDDGYPDLVA